MPLNFDPRNPEQFARLRRAVKNNYRKMKPFREVRRLTVNAARGHYYDTEDDTPDAARDSVNMLDQFQQILIRSFVQSNPRARVTSRTVPKVAAIFQEHLNKTIREINLIDTLRSAVQESILGYLGIVYCGISPTANDPYGESYCDSIGLPNFVVDMGQTEFAEVDLIGHRFARRIDDLIDNESYDQEVVSKLRGRRSSWSELEDRSDRSRDDDEEGSLFDWVDIWAILVKPTNQIIYMSDNPGVDAPLRVESYDGPEFGPYVLLGFDRVPDELMPNSRGALMLDIHDFVNSKYCQIFMKEDQAADFHTYEGGAEEDARRIRDAMDGEVIQVNDNAAVVRRSKPGTNPQALATAIHGRQLFDELSGNLRLLGGVGPIAETATQERLANANASRLVRDMQLQVVEFTKRILQNIAWAEWTHPTRMRRVEIKTGQNGMAIEELWEPAIREGDFIEHEIDIVPDSMEHRSSAQQLEHLIRAVQGMVIPMMQVPSERPVVLKAPEFLRKYSELDNLPELEQVADYAADEAFVTRPSGSTPSIPPAGADIGGQGGQPGRNPEEMFVQQVLSGAVSGQQPESEG